MSYSSPSDFLESVIETRRQPVTLFPTLKIPDAQKPAIMQSWVSAITKLVEQFLAPEERSKVQNRLAFGALQDLEANAFIIRSDCSRFFAILINYGLILLLHQYISLIHAMGRPNCLDMWQGRKDVKVSKQDIFDVLKLLIETYKRNRTVLMPVMHVREGSEIDLTNRVTSANICYFIFCHELGHFFNGDLDDDNLFSAVGQSGLKSMNISVPHSIEHAADISGFAIMQRALKRMSGSEPSVKLLLQIANLFTLLADLGIQTSTSHPAPTARVLHIAQHLYPVEVADGLGAFYEGNPTTLQAYMRTNHP